LRVSTVYPRSHSVSFLGSFWVATYVSPGVVGYSGCSSSRLRGCPVHQVPSSVVSEPSFYGLPTSYSIQSSTRSFSLHAYYFHFFSMTLSSFSFLIVLDLPSSSVCLPLLIFSPYYVLPSVSPSRPLLSFLAAYPYVLFARLSVGVYFSLGVCCGVFRGSASSAGVLLVVAAVRPRRPLSFVSGFLSVPSSRASRVVSWLPSPFISLSLAASYPYYYGSFPVVYRRLPPRASLSGSLFPLSPLYTFSYLARVSLSASLRLPASGSRCPEVLSVRMCRAPFIVAFFGLLLLRSYTFPRSLTGSGSNRPSLLAPFQSVRPRFASAPYSRAPLRGLPLHGWCRTWCPGSRPRSMVRVGLRYPPCFGIFAF